MASADGVARSTAPRAVLAILLGSIVVLASGLALAPWWKGWFGGGRPVGEALRLPGVVEVQEVRLGSKVGGRVREVRMAEGQLVEAGMVLVTFEVPELEAQRAQWAARVQSDEAELTQARNGPRREEIDAAEAAVAASEARAKRTKVGYREEEIREARNDWQSVEADLKYAEEQLARYDRLVQQGSAAKSELDSARANYDRAKGRASAAKAHLDMLAAGNRAEDIAEAEALLRQARVNLALLRAGTRYEEISRLEARLAETRARLAELDANLAEAEVMAPSRSVIDVVGVRKGDLVAPGQSVIRVLRAGDLWVKVFVPETELGRLRIGQKAEVTIDSYPGRTFAGTLEFIATSSEFTPRNVQSLDERSHQVFAAKVRVPDPQGIFKSGMAAQVVIRLEPPSAGSTPRPGTGG